MSHYAVAVFHEPDQNIDELLAPYDENIEVEPYIYLTKKEVIENGKNRRENFIHDMKDDPAYAAGVMEWYGNLVDAYSDEEVYKAECEHSYYENFNELGDVMSTYNPNSKWDWYVIGGRFDDLLKLKPEAVDPNYEDYTRTSSAPLKDLDFSIDKEEYEEYLRWWDIVVNKAPLREGEETPFTIYTDEYYIERYGNRETYAKYCATFSTYAVVTPDGKWHAPGEMGWFACSSESGDEYRDWLENYFERFINHANQETILTIVDCHI